MNLVSVKVRAGIVGFESPANEYVESSLVLDELLIDHPNASYFAVVEGESMIEAGIFPNDLLIISRAAPVTQMSIIVANLNGSFICKYLDKNNRRLVSANPTMPPYVLRDGDEFQIEGVVIRSVRLHVPLARSM